VIVDESLTPNGGNAGEMEQTERRDVGEERTKYRRRIDGVLEK
jgi:hypothetical protein